MSIVITLFRIFYAGTMAVYPTMGMYGTGLIQSAQAGYRLGSHFGLFKPSDKPVNPGPVNEQGTYAWWQDATLIGKSMFPLAQKAFQAFTAKP